MCMRTKTVRENCTLKICANFGMDRAISTSKISRKVYGENDCENVAKAEATDVIWKRAGDNPILPVLITLSSSDIMCAQFVQFSLISS